MKLSKFFTISAATLTLASAGFVFNDFNAPKTVNASKTVAIHATLSKGVPAKFTQPAGWVSDYFKSGKYYARKYFLKQDDNEYSVGLLLYDSKGNSKNAAQVGTFKYELSQKQGHIYFISDLKMKNAIGVQFIGNKMRETDVRLDGKQGNEVAMDFKPYSSLEAISKATGFNFSK